MDGAQGRSGPAGRGDGTRTADRPGPTVLRIGLGSALRKLREQAGVSRGSAGHALRASTAKISRMELGRVGFKLRDVEDLLTLYGVTDPLQRAEFADLARQANEPGWWQRYADLLPGWAETYLGLEQAAQVIRSFELQFVPGLLQTPEYAWAVTRLAHRRPDDISRRVELRMRRQHVLTQPKAPRFWAVVDEAALRRAVSRRPHVLRDQLGHLIELSRLPNVTVQVVPLDYIGHTATGGAFTLLRFAQPDLPDIVYIEQLSSALYLDKRTDVERYAVVMDRLVAHLEPPSATPALLDRIRGEV